MPSPPSVKAAQHALPRISHAVYSSAWGQVGPVPDLSAHNAGQSPLAHHRDAVYCLHLFLGRMVRQVEECGTSLKT
ncbi:hypothetical protein DPMN_179602 [Dreissena polymorpha]|uniref:Uncharacterized protein n=1 Tax=Dreissena polymorpha TaxID=45954 RepID=A0A9D4ECM6_DREPO|nr:hypothetical protein DPMN_179602 [Dreissena polymorpha]